MMKLLLFSLLVVTISSCVSKQKSRSVYHLESMIVSDYVKDSLISSGSGFVRLNDVFYVVGDDDPFLYSMDLDGNVLTKLQIWDSKDVTNNRIIKGKKPDFEAISLFEFEKDTVLLVFGSGSKSPQRDILIMVNPKTNHVSSLNGEEFFKAIRNRASLNDQELNLEGACFHNETLYLFNRANNQLYTISQREMHQFVEKEKLVPSHISVFQFQLPSFDNHLSHFSGASVLSEINHILFSSTIELTEDWIDDGKILGSFIGLIPIEEIKDGKHHTRLVLGKDGNKFFGKIEGLSGEIKQDSLVITFITDDDDGLTGFGTITTRISEQPQP